MLHHAVHIEACDDDDFVCVANRTAEAAGNAIRWTGVTAVAGQLNFLITGELPAACPPGYSLFAETQNGLRYPIGAIESTTAFAGNHDYPQVGKYVVISFPEGFAAVATTRDLCDQWKFIRCMPNSTPSSDPNIVPCGVCNNGGSPAAGTCTLELYVTTDTIRGMKDSEGANTIATANYTDAAALETAIQDWLDANGDGVVTVTGGDEDAGYVWHITIVGGTFAPLGGSIVYHDGIVATAELPFGQSGDCSA
jgi:hypothetical protein